MSQNISEVYTDRQKAQPSGGGREQKTSPVLI